LCFPPPVQRLLGMLWRTKLLPPEAADYDLSTELAEYFTLFYHCDLSESDYHKLTMHSIGE
jgi:iron complex transport system substrate-binding protein